MNETHSAATTAVGRLRPRRLRRSSRLRDLVAEARIAANQLVMPHFLLDVGTREPVPSMPGIDRLGGDDLLRQVESDLELGIGSILLFGVPERKKKDDTGSGARDPEGCVPRAVRALKKRFGADLVVITDVCLCAYTDHGHCGVVDGGRIVNDPTLPLLAGMALVHAEAGADVVAPSDMMDGRVGVLRDALDQGGFEETAILSYAVKYASAYYGPFRDAVDSAPEHGDRRSHQMDIRNGDEAVREALLDEREGADMVMVKPALAYLDVIRRVKEAVRVPLAAYNVSGEYAAVKAAAQNGWLEEPQLVRENLLGMRRAGADIVISYHAREALAKGWV